MALFRFVQGICEDRSLTIYGDGMQQRDFTYIDDIAAGVIASLKPVGYEMINLGSERPEVLLDVIRQVERTLGKRASTLFKPAHPADMQATWADIGKAERLLNWRPRITFSDGLGNLITWYLANRAWARDISTETATSGSRMPGVTVYRPALGQWQ